MFRYSDGAWIGTFHWDAKAKQVTAVALKGQPATSGLTFGQPGNPRPAINSRGEIIFPAEVKEASGKTLGYAVFFRGADGALQAAALPGQTGPDGVTISDASNGSTGAYTSLNDAGRAAFLVRRAGQGRPTAYLWEKGTLTPIDLVGKPAPGGGKIVEVTGAWVNNANRNVLIEAVLDHIDTGLHALYLWDGANLTPVAVPGQPMPGGGQFRTVPWLAVSFPNELGQHAFYARVADGGASRLAAYRMEADGTLSLILKSGAATPELGAISRLGDLDGFGIQLNNKGQVAMNIRGADGRTKLCVLTPAAP
jgi:hypothetical protein